MGAAAGLLTIGASYMLLKSRQTSTVNGFDNVLIGDVGGTNVRLQLIRLFHDSQDRKEELKPLTKYQSREYPSFIACVEDYLKGVDAT
jgi:glucokinase